MELKNYILIDPKSPVGEKGLLKIIYNDDNTINLQTVAIKGPYDTKWEHVNIKSEVEFKSLDEINNSFATYNFTYLTEKEAFVEVL